MDAVSFVVLFAVTAIAAVIGRGLWKLWQFIAFNRTICKLVPTPEDPHWLKGHNATEVLSLTRRFVKAMPRVHRFHLGPLAMIGCCHPETIAQVMRDSLPKDEYLYRFFRQYTGDGLVVTSGSRWRRDRRLLSGLFGSRMLRSYVSHYVSASKLLVANWSTHCNDNVVLCVEESLRLATFDVIMRCTMGHISDCWLGDPSTASTQFLKNMVFVSQTTGDRLLNVFWHSDFIFYRSATGKKYVEAVKHVHVFADNLIAERRQFLQTHSHGDDTVMADNALDVLLTSMDEDGKGMSNTEIRDHVVTFLDAGHTTSVQTLQWIMYYMGKHQDLQQRCRDEVQEILDECGDLDSLEMEHVAKLKYVTQFIQETQRHATLVPYVMRKLAKEMEVDGYNLPTGCTIQVNSTAVHHNPLVWEDPELFDPDRFSPERSAGRHPLAFIPFGMGARNCIGKSLAMDEMRVILSAVLSRFVIHLADDKGPAPALKLFWQPSSPIHFKLEPVE